MDEICLKMVENGGVVCNIALSHSVAQKRWRQLYLLIQFTSSMLSPSNVFDELVSPPESDDADHDYTQKFRNISRADLNDLMKTKNTEMLMKKFDGAKGLAKSLHTTLEHGIMIHDIETRKFAFGSYMGKKPSPKGFFHFLWEAFNKTTIFLLILCAAFSINENGAQEGWDEGYKIFAALILMLGISSTTNFSLESKFYHLSKESGDTKIDVIRVGCRQKVSVYDMVVGDVVILNTGDQVPAYGLLISENSLLVDESSMTEDIDAIEVDANTNPFLLSGSKVAKGCGRMLVMSLGMNTTWENLTNSNCTTCDSIEQTPLESRIKELTISIAKIGKIVYTLVPVIMLIRHFTGYTKYKNGKWENNEEIMDTMDKLKTFTRTLMASIENIPLAVTLTLDYCRKRMMGDKVMTGKLYSVCDTMGSVTVICTDKTGTLTMNQMKVTKCWIGFDHFISDSSLDLKVLQLYHQGVGLNTTGSVYNSLPGMTPGYSGSPTEKAVLTWGVTDLGMDMEKLRKDSTPLYAETFNSKKKRSGVSVRNKEDGTIHVHRKGAATIVLEMCSSYYQKNGILNSITTKEKKRFEKIIQRMAANGLKCIAFAHKEKGNECYTNCEELNEEGLTLLGIVGIKDPCRPGTHEAIKTCRSAKVNIKMITGDNMFTAKAVARECGILKVGQQVHKGDIITGEEFRNYTDTERMEKVGSIRVMASSTPSDKLLMVECLKRKGHVVAVTGRYSDDALALKEADIGLSMHGTEVASESSDNVILYDDFASVVKALKWSRCAYYNIQKFVQFRLTGIIAGLVINFVAAAFATHAPITIVQLLWVNIIMTTLGSLALATEQPGVELMQKRPVRRDAPIITNVMWRNIVAQSIYQVTLLVTFHFRGESLFHLTESVKNTIIFNTFVMCQVFNLFNSRKLEKRNVFKDLHKSHLFLGIIGVTVFIQVVMVEFPNNIADTEKLNLEQWGVCIGVATLTWPIAWFVKLIPVPDTSPLSFIKGWN